MKLIVVIMKVSGERNLSLSLNLILESFHELELILAHVLIVSFLFTPMD